MSEHSIDRLLDRSLELYQDIGAILDDAGIYDLDKAEACHGMCRLSIEHGTSVLLLATHGNAISAASMVRLQFEALVRGMWLWYAATDHSVKKLLAPFSEDAVMAAKNLPSINDMLKALTKAEALPPIASTMLNELREKLLSELNSFVHAGIFPYALTEIGVPDSIVIKTIKHSNGIATMTGMMMANLSGDEKVTITMSKIQPKFADCLPELIPYSE